MIRRVRMRARPVRLEMDPGDTTPQTPGAVVHDTYRDIVSVAEIPVGSPAALLIPADVGRRVVVVQNTGPAAIRVGGTPLDQVSGIRLAPGERVTLRTSGAVRVIREGSRDSAASGVILR